MDFARVEGYLRSACSVLDFDIGEFWNAEKLVGHNPSLNFVQIYTSPTYDRSLRSLLLKPEMSRNEDQAKAEELHQISPVICRSVCDGGQIVWANSNVAEGLVENSKVRLATAVGMPICSVGGHLCVIVLFATQHIPMTPNAVEFLCSMARAASSVDNSSGFAPSSYSSLSPSYAKTDQFRGVWDISARLNSSYSAAIDFHLLPIKRLQAFFDFQEVASFNDLFGKDSAAHPIKTSGQYEFSPFDDFPATHASWEGSPRPETDDSQWINANFHRVRTVSEVTIGETKDFTGYTALTADALTMTDGTHPRQNLTINTAALDTNSCSSSDLDEDEEVSDGSSLEFVFEDDVSRGSSSPICAPSPKGFRATIQIDARTSFRMNQSRFHEFMDAILGLTHFDCAELWLLSARSPELYVVSALHREEAVKSWTMESKGMRLQKGMDVPGVVYETGRPHWDKNYGSRHLRRASRKTKKDGRQRPDFNPSPRHELASKMGMSTAFGVPLPGPLGGISGVLALYSRSKVEPDALLLALVHKSVQLMSSSPTVSPSPDADYYRDFQTIQKQNSFHELPTISENPYSFFCQAPPATISPRNKTMTSAFPFVDYAAKDKIMRGVSDDMESLSDPAMYGQYNSLCAPNKGGWIPANRNINMDLGGQSLYRTVSAKQLTTSPSDTIFHSQSMPDSMYLEGNYSKLDIPKFKRARSVDVGTGGMINATSLSLEQGQGVRQNISIPQGVEVYDHSDLHWSTVNSIAPSSMGHTLGQQHFSYTTEGLEQFPYHLPKQQLQHQVPSHSPMHQYVDFPLPADISSRPLPFDRKAPFHFAMPSLLPVLKMANLPDSSLPTAVTSNGKASAMTQPYETSADAFGTDLGFNGDFGFDHDLAFSAFCATSETVISTPAYPPCRVDGCEADSSHRSPFCVVHPAGGRRCQQEGCNKCAQGSTCYCIAHGGGRRCTFPGCGKGARDKFFCAGHGGGKRCVSSDCTKSAVGGSKFCTGHGGGKRCKVDGCDKSAQSSTLHCVKHGGGRKCTVERCTKVARGKTDFCAAHGGGTRCRTTHCSKAAVGRYQYCRPHYSAIHGSESAAKMTEEEDEYMMDEDEEMRCGDCTLTAVTAA